MTSKSAISLFYLASLGVPQFVLTSCGGSAEGTRGKIQYCVYHDR